MRTHRFCAALLVGGALTFPASAAPPTLRGDLAALFAKPPAPGVSAAACVIDLATGETVFALNADSPLTPASTMKVFTMAAALVELGPDFAFETVLATDGRNLILIGDGDPALGDEKLALRRREPQTAAFDRWAQELLSAGIKAFPGDLIVDDSIFERQSVHRSWEAADLGKWFAAPVAGLNFNDNCLDITLTPSGSSGAPPTVSVFPSGALIAVINQCRSGGRGEPVMRHPPGSNRYDIGGRVSKKWKFGPVPFHDPAVLAGDALRSALAGRGIRVAGGVERRMVRQPDGTLPPTVEVLARTRTPLSDVLNRIGKDSQNLFAEAALKRAGYALSRQQSPGSAEGSWDTGGQAVLSAMRKLGIETTGLRVADGSGLSRENACTARQLATVLAKMHARPEGAMLRESLSIAGVDGSLRKRLRDLPGRIYAKTGTMRSIRSLAGYIDGADGEGGYAFAVMFNGYKGGSGPYKEIQDRVCRVLAGGRPRATATAVLSVPDESDGDDFDTDGAEGAPE